MNKGKHGRRSDAEILAAYDETENPVTANSLAKVCVARLREATQREADLVARTHELEGAIDLVLNCGTWYESALEIDIYQSNELSGIKIEQKLIRLLNSSKMKERN